MKLKLYLDFDGVILNTSHITDKRLKELNITSDEEIKKYHLNIDWNKLLEETEPVNDSISNIKKIIDSNLYDVEILTHVNSNTESILKEEYINKYFNDIKVITVLKQIDKCDAVNPKNCILIDDYIGNLEKWDSKGGIAIKFSDNHKKCKYLSVDNLSQIIDLYDEIISLIKNKQVVTNE